MAALGEISFVQKDFDEARRTWLEILDLRWNLGDRHGVVGSLAELARVDIQSGYEYRAEINRDHVPLGEDEDPTLWAKLFFCEPQGRRRTNVHARVSGRPNQRYPLLFRDYLRAHPNSARTIELIKRELAKRHGHDVDAYYAIKDPVYDLIWDAARDWARQISWEPA